MRKRFGKQRLAAAGGVARLCCKTPARPKQRIRQKIDVLDIGHDPVEHRRRRFGTSELVDNHIANKIAQ